MLFLVVLLLQHAGLQIKRSRSLHAAFQVRGDLGASTPAGLIGSLTLSAGRCHCVQDLFEDTGDLPAVFWSTLRFLSTNSLQVSGLFTDGNEDNRKVLLMRRLYDNGQDPIKLLPAASRDPHAVRS